MTTATESVTALPETTPATPEVGNAATFTTYTDSHACTIIEVRRNGRELVLREDKWSLLNGADSGAPDALEFSPGGFCGHTSGEQRYRYEPNPNGRTYRVTRRVRRDGSITWKRVGHPTKSPGCVARLGVRERHYDFNF